MWQKSEILKSKFWSTLKIILLKMFFFVVKNRHFRQKFGLLAKILDIWPRWNLGQKSKNLKF